MDKDWKGQRELEDSGERYGQGLERTSWRILAEDYFLLWKDTA